jgi:hypothetical protein
MFEPKEAITYRLWGLRSEATPCHRGFSMGKEFWNKFA